MIRNLEQIIEETPEGIVIINKSLEVVYINTRAVIILKIPTKQAVGVPLSSILFPNNPTMSNVHNNYMTSIFDSGVSIKQSMGDRLVAYGDMSLRITLRIIEGDYCVAFIEDRTEIEELKTTLAGKLTVQDQLVLKASDIRMKIIIYLFSTIISLAVITTLTNNKERSQTLDVLLAGLTGSLTSTLGFYFRQTTSKDED